MRHRGVSRVAVVEAFDRAGLPGACAFVVADPAAGDHYQLEQSLRQTAGEVLPRFKQPRRYLFVAELPYTATGKIQRFKLREKLKESPRSKIQNLGHESDEHLGPLE